jgi:hypothetical protein
MKLSDKTVKILKNYSEINSGIAIKKGNKLTTISGGPSTLVSVAEVPDQFPQDINIFNLDKFLAVQSLFTEPELEFGDDKIVIHSGNRSVEYFYSNVASIKVPKKSLPIPDRGIEFDLTANDLASIKKASSILEYKQLHISGNGKTITVEAKRAPDAANNVSPTSGSFKLDTNVPTDQTFSTTLIIANMKMLEGNYKVRVGEEFVHFEDKDLGLQYWVIKAADQD